MKANFFVINVCIIYSLLSLYCYIEKNTRLSGNKSHHSVEKRLKRNLYIVRMSPFENDETFLDWNTELIKLAEQFPLGDNTPCWGVTLTVQWVFISRGWDWTAKTVTHLWSGHSNALIVSLKMKARSNKLYSTDIMAMISLPFLFCHSYFLPRLLAPLCNLCLCHLWHQPAHRHLCQAWQPEPRCSAWLSSIDSFRQLHPDSDLYGGSLIYPRPLCEGSSVFCLMNILLLP